MEKLGPHDPKTRAYWLDDPRNVDKLLWVLALLCAGFFMADLFYHKHVNFPFEGWFGFFGWYGFFSCVGLVLAAKRLRVILKRAEDYYD